MADNEADASTALSDPSSTRRREDFLFLAELGEGSYSTVYLASERQTSRKFAVKICLKNKIVREKKVQQIFRERDILRLLSTPTNACPFVVRLFCTFQDSESLYFVLSLAPKKDLLALLKKRGRFSVGQCQFVMAELLVALEHIHSLGIIHRDIKPENILLREDGHILLSDFGCAKQLLPPANESDDAHGNGNNANDGSDDDDHRQQQHQHEQQQPSAESADGGDTSTGRSTESEEERRRHTVLKRRCSFVGSGAYVSPEILNGSEVTEACDWWAFGVTLFQLLSGRLPFSADSEYLLFRQVLALSYQFPDDFPCCESARQLVQALLVLVPAERAGSPATGGPNAIRRHPFFADIDWASAIGQQTMRSPLFDQQN